MCQKVAFEKPRGKAVEKSKFDDFKDSSKPALPLGRPDKASSDAATAEKKPWTPKVIGEVTTKVAVGEKRSSVGSSISRAAKVAKTTKEVEPPYKEESVQ